jgi:hypothetical protein
VSDHNAGPASGAGKPARAAPPVFARHDTFHPRHGWLKKGFDFASEDPKIFARENASVELGVGKNMVRAIRYWCLAFDLLAEGDGPGETVPTAFGRWLLDDQSGRDPFLESAASLWLLHWRLLRDTGVATAWRFSFFDFTQHVFSTDELSAGLKDFVARTYSNAARLADSSFDKDAACLVRMYTQAPPEQAISEETLQCPFVALGLLRGASDTPTGRARVQFQVGEKPTLSPMLVAATCVERVLALESSARTISIHDLARGTTAPGLAFRLGESALYQALDSAAVVVPGLRVAVSGGISQLAVEDPPKAYRSLMARAFDASAN